MFNFEKELVNVVYGHRDWADFEDKIEKRMLHDNASYETMERILQLILENPTVVGGAFLDSANRALDGVGPVIHPATLDIGDINPALRQLVLAPGQEGAYHRVYKPTVNRQ